MVFKHQILFVFGRLEILVWVNPKFSARGGKAPCLVDWNPWTPFS